jgi:ATP-binding cassette subfamily G (WHITE) protein 2
MANVHALLDLVETIACSQVRLEMRTYRLHDADWILVCGSLADGKDRPMRQGDYCECEDGWTGINCNVCTKNKACNALMPEGEGGVCYQNGEVVKTNYQMCDVTNRKIVEILDGRRPQVTFTCDRDDDTCAFQCEYTSTRSIFIADNP